MPTFGTCTEFEDLLQIWDFSCSFSDYLEIKIFKLEELSAGLQYSGEEEVGLVSDLFSGLAECLIWDIEEELTDDSETMLWLIKEYVEKNKLVWPEIIR